jgi:hypothetical protein
MGNVTTIGLDIAKSVFQAHGVDAAGEVVRWKLTRGRVLAFFENLMRCLVGILQHVTLLGAGAHCPRSRRAPAPGAICEALSEATEERCGRCGSHL